MDNKFSRIEIAKGVHFSRYIDNRFKINRIEVLFMDKLSRDTASVNAVIPALLSRSSAEYPTMRELNARLSGLYSASLGDTAKKRGDIQFYGLFATALDDSYAIEHEKVLSELVKLLCGCLFRPNLENGVFPEKNLEVQKQNYIDANDAEINDKAAYSNRKGTAETFKDEPAGINVFGENEDIRKITPESAYKAYLDMIKTKNVEIICVGTSDFTEAEAQLKEEFLAVGREPAFYPENNASAVKEKPSYITETIDVTQSKLFLSFKTDYEDIHSLRIMSVLLGGGVTSKLFTIVREKLSLCYYCYSRLMSEKKTMTVESGVSLENIEKAKNEIIYQLEEIANGNFTDEEFERVKRSLQNDYRSVNDWVSTISSWYLNRIIDGKIESPEEMLEHLLAVTKEQTAEAARSLKLDTVYVLTNGKEDEVWSEK